MNRTILGAAALLTVLHLLGIPEAWLIQSFLIGIYLIAVIIIPWFFSVKKPGRRQIIDLLILIFLPTFVLALARDILWQIKYNLDIETGLFLVVLLGVVIYLVPRLLKDRKNKR